LTLAVVDAAAVVDLLCGFPPAEHVRTAMEAGTGLAAPAHLDAEVFSALARLERAGNLPDAEERVRALSEMPVERFPLAPLLMAAYALTPTIAARDALYVSLALSLEARLITTDDRLARAVADTVELA
jgi:predicted nucleic acid-binding protein